MLKKLFVAGLATALSFQSSFAQSPQKIIRTEFALFEITDEGYRGLGFEKYFESGNCTPLDAVAETKLKEQLRELKKNGALDVLGAPSTQVMEGEEAAVSIQQGLDFKTKIMIECIDNEVVFVPKNEHFDTGVTLKALGKISEDKRFLTMEYKFNCIGVENIHSVTQVPVMTLLTPIYEGGSQGQPIPITQFLQKPKLFQFSSSINVKMRAGVPHLIEIGKHNTQAVAESKIPGIGDIPYLQNLFTTRTVKKEVNHSIILVKSQVVDGGNQQVQPPAQGLLSTNSTESQTPILTGLNASGFAEAPCPSVTYFSGVKNPNAPLKEMPPSLNNYSMGKFTVCNPDVVVTQQLSLPNATPTPAPVQQTGWTTVQIIPLNGSKDSVRGISNVAPINVTEFLFQQTPPSVPAPVPPPVAVAPPAMFTMSTPEFRPIALDYSCPLSVEKVVREDVTTPETATNNSKDAEILKILMEQYEVACKAGDNAKAKTIAAYCLKMDPTCFAKK